MNVAVQQIVYTSQPERWWALAESLGFIAAYPPSPEWGEFHADGVLAVHSATAQHRPGMVDIHLLVDDLDAASSALSAFEITRADVNDVGEILTVHADSGVMITVSTGTAATAAQDVAVQPIWFQEDLAEPRAILVALGLRTGISADRGGWTEMLSDNGSVGLHAGEPRIGLSFEARGDLDALASKLTDAGFATSVVDEAFARTVRVADPDGGAGVWINGIQDDLHGYHR